MTNTEAFEEIRQEVHQPLKVNEYDSTEVRKNTNCYSHAIGATYSYICLYRIGAISGLKEIDEEYSSIEEIIELLKKDLEVLNLNYEVATDLNLKENQHIIKLYVKRYADGRIGDYHFIRYENGKYTEKWRNHGMQECNEKRYETSWMWSHVLSLKITR